MIKNSKVDNDEINLIELMYVLWNGKWKIAVVVVISLIAVISYQSTKTNDFTAITEIKPIADLELIKFIEFNNLITNTNINSNTNTNTNTNSKTNTNTNSNTSTNTNINTIGTSESGNTVVKINKITGLSLLNMYINVLNEKLVFEDAIRKFNLLEASQYNNEQEYSEAIIRLASTVKILSPPIRKKNLETSYSTYSTINFEYHDEEKWKSVLTYVNEFTNKLVKQILTQEYDNTLEFLISGFVKTNETNIDTARNELMEVIEEALETDITRNGNALDTEVVSIETDAGTLFPYGGVSMIVRVIYEHQAGTV